MGHIVQTSALYCSAMSIIILDAVFCLSLTSSGELILEALNEWGTFIAAMVAAITSTISWWRGFFDKDDKVKVSFGAIQPPTAAGYGMHVTSRADHAMTIQDYGFFDRRGRLLSIPDMLANEDCDDGICIGGSVLLEKRGSTFELAYVVLRDDQIGAFAKTTGQDTPKLCFRPGVKWYLRWMIRMKSKLLRAQFQ